MESDHPTTITDPDAPEFRAHAAANPANAAFLFPTRQSWMTYSMEGIHNLKVDYLSTSKETDTNFNPHSVRERAA